MIQSRIRFLKFGYQGHYLALLMQISLNAFCVFVTIMILPLMTRKIIDEGIVAKSLPHLLGYSGVSLLAVSIYALTSIWVHHIKDRVIDRRIYEICMSLYDKAILVPQKDFAANSGYLSTRIFRDVKDYVSKLLRFTTNMSNCFFGLIIACSFLIVSFGWLGVYMCIGLSFYPFLFQKTGKKIAASTIQFNETLARFNETVVDHLQSKVSLVTLGIFDLGREKYSRSLAGLLGQNHELRTMSVRYSVGSTFVSQVIQVLILIITGYAAFAAGGSIGKTIAGMTVATMVMNYLTSFKQILPQIYGLEDYAKRIQDTQAMLEENPAAASIEAQYIELSDASLGVDKKTLFSKLNMRVALGSALHLKGQNGSGKTSLVMALAGLQKGLTGAIESPSRENIAYLAPAPSLINISIKDYIDHLRGSVLNKAQLERLWQEFGLSSLEDQTAKQLSLGETQKLQLLLAFAKDPDFLIFDECFSGIDKNSMPLVKVCIDEQSHRKGLIYVDHRSEAFSFCHTELNLSALK